jgi:hypothetical protein
MHVTFDRIVPACLPAELPIRLEQATLRTGIVLRLILLIPALAIVAVPLTMLAAHAVAEPTAWHYLTGHPLTAMQILLAIGLCIVLFVLPLRRLLARAGATRVVEIGAGTVAVTDRGLLRTHAWSTPLAGYRGVAHHVRTGLSGVRHELILVHAEPARHVLLAIGPSLSAEALARTAGLLGLSVIQARELYAPSPAPSSLPDLLPAPAKA